MKNRDTAYVVITKKDDGSIQDVVYATDNREDARIYKREASNEGFMASIKKVNLAEAPTIR